MGAALSPLISFALLFLSIVVVPFLLLRLGEYIRGLVMRFPVWSLMMSLVDPVRHIWIAADEPRLILNSILAGDSVEVHWVYAHSTLLLSLSMLR